MADALLPGAPREFDLDALIGALPGDGLWARTLAARLKVAGLRVRVHLGEGLGDALPRARHLILFVPGPTLGEADAQRAGFAPLSEGDGAPPPGSITAPRRLIPLIVGEAPGGALEGFPALDLRSQGVLEGLYATIAGALRQGGAPQPEYRSEALRALGEALSDAQDRVDALGAGEDVLTRRQLDARIRQLKSELREGGDLVEGFILGGRYRLLGRVGVGGFGTVWRAWDRRRGAQCALKILHTQHIYNPSRITRFFRGAAAMARLSHPGIVSVHSPREVDGGYHYFVMDFVDGVSFQRLVLRGLLDRGAILRGILSVGDALSHAHREGIVHRDIKPSNILIDRQGQVHLTDFDLVWSADGDQSLTTGALGTFVFAAPEQLKIGEPVSASRDVYSLGMTTVFALHGASLAPAILFERESFIEGLQIKSGLKAVLKAAVSLRPEDRYGSMAMFCRALEGEWGG